MRQKRQGRKALHRRKKAKEEKHHIAEKKSKEEKHYIAGKKSKDEKHYIAEKKAGDNDTKHQQVATMSREKVNKRSTQRFVKSICRWQA